MPVLWKKRSSKECGSIGSVWPSWVWGSQHATTGNSVSWSLGRSSRSSFHRRATRTAGYELISPNIFLLSWERLSFWSYLSTLGTNISQIFYILSSSRIIVCTVLTLTSNCALIVSINTRRSLSMKFFICPIKSGVLTPLLLPHLSSFFTDSLRSWSLLCHAKTDAWFMQDSPKAVWSVSICFCGILPSLKHNIIVYRSFKVSSRPDGIFEIHQLWQSGFSWVYSNSFEPEIVKMCQPSHKMNSNNILYFQEFTTNLNTCTKSLETYWRPPCKCYTSVGFWLIRCCPY